MPQHGVRTTNSLTIWLDELPPYDLSKNGRLSWVDRHSLYQDYKLPARTAINRILTQGHLPWSGAVYVHIKWHYKRNAPDRDNCIERCACIMDAGEQCQLFVNDSQIADYTVEYVKGSDEGVQVTFTHEGAG